LNGEYHNEEGALVVSLPRIEMGFNIPWVLIAIRSVSVQLDVIRQKRLLNEIKTFPIIKRSILFRDDIIIAVSRNSLEQTLREIKKYIKPQYYSIGISLPFSKIEDAYSRYHQCMAAINTGKKPVNYAEEIAFSYLLAETKKANAGPFFRHPALEILRKKDSKSATELYKTLREYLFHERNNNETAKTLKIHRNTLSYRLLQIEELTALRLDDIEERHFVLLSFLLDK
jgi:sugar diacid utilization regulator